VFADAGTAVIWGLTQLALGLEARRLRFQCDAAPGTAGCILHGGVLFWACLVVVATVLSLLRALTGYALLAGVACSCAVGLYALRCRSAPRGIEAGLSGQTGCWVFTWCLMFALAAYQSVREGLLRFPHDFDALMYHLPLIDHWLQARSLYAPDSLHWSNPGNGELLGLWLAAPFSGDFLAPLVNLPFSVLLAAAALETARNLGLSRGWAHAAALTVVAHRVVWRQLTDVGNDVPVAAAFLAVFAYGLRFARWGRGTDLVLGGLALGLLAGVKYYALGYAAVVWLVSVVLVAVVRGWRPGLRLAAVWLAGGMLCGGYWYLRNLAVSGSPFYPLGMRQADDVLSQVYPDVRSTTFLGNGRPEIQPLLRAALWTQAGPLHYLACLGLPATMAWLVIGGHWRQAAPFFRLASRWGLVGLLGGSLLVWAITPMAMEDVPGSLNQLRGGYAPMRYGLGLASAAVIAAALLLSDLAKRHVVRVAFRARSFLPAPLRALAGTFLAGAAAAGVQQLNGSGPAGGRLGILLDLAFLTLLILQLLQYWRAIAFAARRAVFALRAGALALALAGAAFEVGGLADHWHRQFAAFYDGLYQTRVFRAMDVRDPAGIRPCVLEYWTYPWFGSRRQFRVCQPVLVPSYSLLDVYLGREQCSLLVVKKMKNPELEGLYRYKWGYHWASHHPERFGLEAEGASVAVFRIHPPP
jgi:hypothetical protein